eukprot:3285296-Amphidinium_carterae.1
MTDAGCSTALHEELREKGNLLYREGHYQQAVKVYTASIDADDSDARMVLRILPKYPCQSSARFHSRISYRFQDVPRPFGTATRYRSLVELVFLIQQQCVHGTPLQLSLASIRGSQALLQAFSKTWTQSAMRRNAYYDSALKDSCKSSPA